MVLLVVHLISKLTLVWYSYMRGWLLVHLICHKILLLRFIVVDGSTSRSVVVVLICLVISVTGFTDITCLSIIIHYVDFLFGCICDGFRSYPVFLCFHYVYWCVEVESIQCVCFCHGFCHKSYVVCWYLVNELVYSMIH